MNNQDIEIIRGDDVIVTLKLLGDFTSNTAYFTIKEKDDLTGVRYVDLSTGSGIVATYNGTYTTFQMTIPKANTNQLTFSEMVYDLVFDEDTTVIEGSVKLIHDVRTPYDNSTIPDTLASSSIIVQRPTASGITSFSVSSINDIYGETVSGDLVIVKADQDAEDNMIQWKDGVNWQFEGNPTISGDSTDGTYGDDNSAVNVHIAGDVNIVNTNGLASRIIMQNASSNLNGFHWEYRANISATAAGNITATILKNTLGGVPVWTRSSAGIWDLTLTGAFSGTRIFRDHVITNVLTEIGQGQSLIMFRHSANSDNILTLRCESFLTPSTDNKALYDSGFAYKDYTIKVYP